MDEPFGALDEMTRERLNEVLPIGTRTGIDRPVRDALDRGGRVPRSRGRHEPARPGRITDVVDVDLPRPRDFETREQPRYFELVTEVREALRRGADQAEPGEPGADKVAAAASAERTMAEGGIG